jgi:hypothetical protein
VQLNGAEQWQHTLSIVVSFCCNSSALPAGFKLELTVASEVLLSGDSVPAIGDLLQRASEGRLPCTLQGPAIHDVIPRPFPCWCTQSLKEGKLVRGNPGSTTYWPYTGQILVKLSELQNRTERHRWCGTNEAAQQGPPCNPKSR